MATIPSKIPPRFRQGTTVKWTKSLADYLPTDGWTLTYRFTRVDAAAALSVAATDNGDGRFLITIPASAGTPDTADFIVGDWGYIGQVSKAGEVYTVDPEDGSNGTISVDPSFATVVETRSAVKLELDLLTAAIQSALENRALVVSYSISTGSGSRSINIGIDSAYARQAELQRKYDRELAKVTGRSTKNKVQVTFV